jgi:hypothetical protein
MNWHAEAHSLPMPGRHVLVAIEYTQPVTGRLVRFTTFGRVEPNLARCGLLWRVHIPHSNISLASPSVTRWAFVPEYDQWT